MPENEFDRKNCLTESVNATDDSSESCFQFFRFTEIDFLTKTRSDFGQNSFRETEIHRNIEIGSWPHAAVVDRINASGQTMFSVKLEPTESQHGGL